MLEDGARRFTPRYDKTSNAKVMDQPRSHLGEDGLGTICNLEAAMLVLQTRNLLLRCCGRYREWAL
jgi:hypothetical protein